MENLKIHHIKTDFNFPPFHINAYLIKINKYSILFDTGIKSNNTIETIKKEIKDFGGIDCIILSHGHLDHAGCAGILSNILNVPIYISFEERERISEDFNSRVKRRIERILKIADFFGLDKKSTEREYEKIRYYENLFYPIDVCFNIDSLNIDGLEIIKIPGHTNGSIGLFIKSERMLLSGDALLKDGISPFFDSETLIDSLKIYENSLNYLNYLNIEKVLPGHGQEFTNPKNIIKTHLNYIETTKSKIKKLLKKNFKIQEIFKTVFPENLNLLIALSIIINVLEELQIPILQNLKDLLSE